MKVVINKCHGGYSLSARAVQRLAEIQGRPCFFFKQDAALTTYIPADVSECESLWWSAFDIPNPNEVMPNRDAGAWRALTDEERKADSALYESHYLDSRPKDRTDTNLIRVIEELGGAASGRCAELKIVEIPDGIQWEVEEYDGLEWIAETHRVWS